MPHVWNTWKKGKLDLMQDIIAEFWCRLIDWWMQNSISLFTSLMQLTLLSTCVHFLLKTDYALTITITTMLFSRPYKSEPADLSAPWASKTPPVLHSPATLTATFPAWVSLFPLIPILALLKRRRRGTEKEKLDVTALVVNLLFRCLAFSAVALPFYNSCQWNHLKPNCSFRAVNGCR